MEDNAKDLVSSSVSEDDLEESSLDFESTLEDLDNEPNNVITQSIEKFHQLLIKGTKGNSLFKTIFWGIVFLLYNSYLITGIAYHIRNETDFSWCDGLGFLIVITALVYFGMFYYHVIKPYLGEAFEEKVLNNSSLNKIVSSIFFQFGAGGLVLAAILVFIVIDTKDNRKGLISTLGLLVLVLIGFVLSKHPGRVRWRHVIWGMGLQFIFGLIVLRWDTGRDILKCVSDKVNVFLRFTDAGSGFVYGYLATGDRINTTLGDQIELPGVFAFQALSVIYFFSFMVALLYHYGAMTWVVQSMGWLLEISVGTTACESMSASANIFLGQTEAPLVVKPYIAKMTNSELHSIMTGGFATIAGSTLGAYISFGIDPFHLLSASLMSAPAALAFSKLLYPETKKSLTSSSDVRKALTKNKGNALDAAAQGASQATILVVNIIAGLVAITAFVAFLNAVVNWLAILVGQEQINFEWLVAKLFTPIAWVIGIDNEEVEDVALLLGLKTVVNEFIAYQLLTEMCLSPRSVTITTYALCCFANFSSIGIQLGALAALCPQRSKDLAKAVFSAFVGGNAAALMTACVAGTLSKDDGYDAWYPTRNCSVGDNSGKTAFGNYWPSKYI